MSIVEGSSVFRRRLLDMVLALIIPSYAARLSEYRRGVRQKALFLKRGMPSMIADRALLPLASWIWRMREEGVALLADSLGGFEQLAPFGIGLSLSAAARASSMTAPTITRRRSSSPANASARCASR